MGRGHEDGLMRSRAARPSLQGDMWLRGTDLTNRGTCCQTDGCFITSQGRLPSLASYEGIFWCSAYRPSRLGALIIRDLGYEPPEAGSR